MVGGPGVDGDGYPLETADKRAVLRLLRARKFDVLERWLNDLQSQFEADSRKEYWPLDALDAFNSADPTLVPLIDAWATDQPDSYMALTARAIQRLAAGWYQRGHKWAHETPAWRFQRMEAEHEGAVPELAEALK